MAVVKSILKLTNGDCIVKVAGTAGVATISLATDLIHATEALSGAPFNVTITTLTWSGDANGVIFIDRNNIRVTTLLSGSCNQLDFGSQFCVPESTQASQDIVVTISGGQAEIWIRLQKVAGYANKLEPERFSIYDNPNVVGA